MDRKALREPSGKYNHAEALKRVPLVTQDVDKWPSGVRVVALEELDNLGIDRTGRLYWDGRPVEVRAVRLKWPERFFALLGVSGALTVGLVEGWRWACELAWLGSAACPVITR